MKKRNLNRKELKNQLGHYFNYFERRPAYGALAMCYAGDEFRVYFNGKNGASYFSIESYFILIEKFASKYSASVS